MSASDPSGFVSDPPRTVVKVINTAREDMNGQLGIVVGYQTDRGRYLVHNVSSQQTMALKPENLSKANMMESVKAQYTQLRNDPRVQQQVNHYYDVAKQRLHPVKPEVALGIVLVVWFAFMYLVGFSKTLMITSLVLMLGIMVAPDVTQGASLRTVVSNVPRRSREAIENAVPQLKGRLSNRMAGGILVVMLGLALLSLFSSGTQSTAVPQKATAPHVSSHSKDLQEQFYKMGFEDATNGLDFGSSLKQKVRGLEEDEGFDYDYIPPPPPKQRSFGFGSIMSLFFIFRTLKEAATDPNGGFNMQLMATNLMAMDALRLGLLGFSVLNLVRSLM